MDTNIDELISIPLPFKEDNLIKVMGVGGGGCNAVNYLYSQGIDGVSFLVCNTDRQALGKSSVPAKLQLGPGLGAGGVPEKAQEYAEQNKHLIHDALDDGTQMLFITAGQGGGTGTGASPIVAEVARDMGILTVGIVTIPFAFEGQKKIKKAMIGVAKLAEQVDAILIINNEKLKQIYPELPVFKAFAISDDVVANAARAIAEIITVPGYINTDFQDVYNTLKDGKVAIMNVGRAKGEERITNAIRNALDSPLVNTTNVHGAKRVLIQLYCSTEFAIQAQEFDQVHRFVDEMGSEVEVQWGASIDESLGEEVRITIVATGYDVESIPSLSDVEKAIESNYKEPAATETKEPVKDDTQVFSSEDQVKETEQTEDTDEEIEINLEPKTPRSQSPFTNPVRAVDPSDIRVEEDEETEQSTSLKDEIRGWFRSRR